MAKIKISKQEKIEGLLLIVFLLSNIVFFLLKCNDLVIISASLIIITLLMLWIKNAKIYIEKTIDKLIILLCLFSVSIQKVRD